MITTEQKEQRKLGLGGSDIPIVLGLSSYKTPYQLYLEKKETSISGDEMSPVQYWGNQLEPVIREEFSKRNNVTIELPDTLIHPFHNFMRANVDGYIKEWDAVLEVKCANQFMAYEWGEPGCPRHEGGEARSDVIPMAYLAQVAHYCIVTNATQAHIAVLIGGHDYREYKYTRDTELENTIIEAASAFWNAVQNDLPPPPVNQKDLRMMFPRHNPEKTLTISQDVSPHFTKMNEVKRKIKELQEIEEESKFQIMKHMEDSECLVDESGKPLVTWKTNKKGSRTFLFKGDKE